MQRLHPPASHATETARRGEHAANPWHEPSQVVCRSIGLRSSDGFKKISKVLCDWDQDVMRTAKPAVHASKIITNSWNSRISNSYKFLQIFTDSYKFLHILQENGLPLSFRAFTRFEHISDSQPQFLSSSAGDAQNVLYTLLILAEDSLNVVYYDP